MVPTASCPRIRPGVVSGTSPFRMWRSVPQIVVASTRTMTSPSCSISGSATSLQLFRPGPSYTSAFIVLPPLSIQVHRATATTTTTTDQRPIPSVLAASPPSGLVGTSASSHHVVTFNITQHRECRPGPSQKTSTSAQMVGSDRMPRLIWSRYKRGDADALVAHEGNHGEASTIRRPRRRAARWDQERW